MPTSGLEVLEKWKWKRVSVSEEKMGETGSCFHGAPSMVTWCTSTHTCQAPAISDSWSMLHQQRCQPVAWGYWKNGNRNRFLFPRKKWGTQDPVSAVLRYLKTRKCIRVNAVQTCLNMRVQVRMRTGAQRAPYQSMRVQVRAVQTAGNALTVNMRTAPVQVRAHTGMRFAVVCIWCYVGIVINAHSKKNVPR